MEMFDKRRVVIDRRILIKGLESMLYKILYPCLGGGGGLCIETGKEVNGGG